MQGHELMAGVPDADLAKVIDGDWNIGLVFYQPVAFGEPVQRLVENPRDSNAFVVSDGAATSEIATRFRLDLSKIVDEANALR